STEGQTRSYDDRVIISMRHQNGSISHVWYDAGGDKAFPAERIEVFGGGRAATIEQWGTIDLWTGGRRMRVDGKGDKGHRAEFASFLKAIREGGPAPVPWLDIRGTTWAALAAVQSLSHGEPVWDAAKGDSGA